MKYCEEGNVTASQEIWKDFKREETFELGLKDERQNLGREEISSVNEKVSFQR